MAKFEAHITLPREAAETVKAIGEHLNWTFSAIDGDPIMGKQAYCYLTAYSHDAKLLRASMAIAAGSCLMNGVDPLRQKIERIIFDTKTGVDELSGQ